LEVEAASGRVVFTPKTLVDKHVEERIEEGLDDFAKGRSHGPFDTAEKAVEFLHANMRGKRTHRGSSNRQRA
jgi:hypothetical protein